MPRYLVAAMLVLACCTAVLVGVPLAVSLPLPKNKAHAKPRDRDHDRLPDVWEKRYRLSTHRRSTNGDPDHDRLTNLSEYRARTNPRRADTDGDGLSDRAELRRYHTNPRRADTDGDGFPDGAEVRAGTNPRRRDSKPAPTSSSGSCAVRTPNVPDGPDPWGGCFPGPSNTGAPAGVTLANYTGPCTITTANVVIDSKTVNCDIEVGSGGSGLIIKNSLVNGSVEQSDNGTSSPFTIQDSTIDGTVRGTGTGHDGYACTNCGVGYRDFTLLRVEVVHTNRGAYCEEVCNISDSWVHGQNLWPDDPAHPHASAIRQEHYANLQHNSLACDYKGPFNADIGCSANQSGYPDFTYIWHNTFNRNLHVEGNNASSFCAYGGGTSGKPFSGDARNATYQVYTNNVFQRGANGKCGDYGPITDFLTSRTGNTWTDNIWDHGGTVNPA